MDTSDKKMLKDFLTSRETVVKKNRYKFQIDGREVDFNLVVPLPSSKKRIPVWLAKNLGLLKIAWHQALPAIFESIRK